MNRFAFTVAFFAMITGCAANVDSVDTEDETALEEGSTIDHASEALRRGNVGDMCANRISGTPNHPCAVGLICVYDNGTFPRDPAVSSSAATGTCQEPVEAGRVGDACSAGVLGTP